MVNDADAAGLAEASYGAARGEHGLVIVTTLGTGIGAALVYDGVLVPNAELGHLEIDGHNAESRAANSAREREDLSWEEWAERLTRYYTTLEMLFSPTCSWSEAASASAVTSSCHSWGSAPRSSRPSCATGRDRRRRPLRLPRRLTRSANPQVHHGRQPGLHSPRRTHRGRCRFTHLPW